MTYDEILANAGKCMGPYCNACKICNGRYCSNSMPGPGSKYPGNTAARNYDKWQEILVNMDTLCENRVPNTEISLFGRTFSAPVFAAPVGAIDMHYGSKYIDQEYNKIVIKAAYEAGSLAFTGDGVNPEIMKSAVADSKAVEGVSIPTIKPWNKEMVFEKLDILNENRVIAAAMDIDGAGLPFLKAMNPNAGSKSPEEMKEIIDYAHMPFIIKGIMTAKAAEKAVEAGAYAIVVSNHGGRVQGGVPSTAEVLPEISKAVKGKIKIFVDGGIRSGLDIFRALALGADAVLVGRPFVTAVYGGGAEGFNIYYQKLLSELKSTMTMCGTGNLKEICMDNIFTK